MVLSPTQLELVDYQEPKRAWLGVRQVFLARNGLRPDEVRSRRKHAMCRWIKSERLRIFVDLQRPFDTILIRASLTDNRPGPIAIADEDSLGARLTDDAVGVG